MSKSKRSPVQRYHDRIAARYDETYDDAFWKWHDALTWDYLKPFLPSQSHARILDLGCGTGKWAVKLIQSGFHVVCVDISPQMLEQARGKIEAMGKLDRAEFVQADLCDLNPLPEHGAQMAIALGDPIGCSAAPALALKQIRRKLVAGGSWWPRSTIGLRRLITICSGAMQESWRDSSAMERRIG